MWSVENYSGQSRYESRLRRCRCSPSISVPVFSSLPTNRSFPHHIPYRFTMRSFIPAAFASLAFGVLFSANPTPVAYPSLHPLFAEVTKRGPTSHYEESASSCSALTGFIDAIGPVPDKIEKSFFHQYHPFDTAYYYHGTY